MESETFMEILTLLSAYMLGSIPFGVLISWLYDLQDPREVGSHSTGATNVLRSGNKYAALQTLALDILKGSAAVLFAYFTTPSLIQVAAVVVVIGHIWPIWYGFKGGKGVATALGTILIISWPLAVACSITWGIIAYTSRYSSLASLVAVLLSPLFTAILSGPHFVILTLLLALLIVWTHRGNIGRLLTGSEPKIASESKRNVEG